MSPQGTAPENKAKRYKNHARCFRKHWIPVGRKRSKKDQKKDFDFLLNLGELFTLVAYGQLIIEKFQLDNFDADILDQIFDFMIRDFSRFALNLYSKTNTTALQKYFCKRMIRKPAKDIDRSKRVLQNHIYSLKDQYEMNS